MKKTKSSKKIVLKITMSMTTARTTFSDGEKYPTTKEVRLLLTLRLVSVIVTGL